jgi:hypothetical protein
VIVCVKLEVLKVASKFAPVTVVPLVLLKLSLFVPIVVTAVATLANAVIVAPAVIPILLPVANCAAAPP